MQWIASVVLKTIDEHQTVAVNPDFWFETKVHYFLEVIEKNVLDNQSSKAI
jgi:hypothetical protein